jgi:hypothetical protein
MNTVTSENRNEPRYVGDASARWPDGRPLCGHDKGHDAEGIHIGYCRNTAGMRTPHFGIGSCWSHGGTSPSHVAKAERETAAAALRTYGLPREIDPVSALFEEVHRTAGAVAWLGEIVALIDPENLVWGVTQETDSQSGEFPGLDTVRQAKPVVWLELYRLERKHLVDVCKTVVSLQLEDRRDRAGRQQAAQMFLLMEAMLTDSSAALSASQQAAMRRALLVQVEALDGPPRRSKVIAGEVAGV